MQTSLIHELIYDTAHRDAAAIALTSGPESMSYGALWAACERFAAGLASVRLPRAARVAVYLDKRIEFVVAVFGAAMAGGTFVPINPLLKPEQVAHILTDCAATVLVTSAERLSSIASALSACPSLRHIVVVGQLNTSGPACEQPLLTVHHWESFCTDAGCARASNYRIIDADMAAILYTSGSTGRPKGVVLSHRNMVIGAKSVAQYLENRSSDTLLAALPLSFDAGFSQLTTAFHAGARVVLLNYLLPRDVLNAVVKERVTGITGVPPLWNQLAQIPWPESVSKHLRYIASTGGRMPLEVLRTLREKLPTAKPYLMYGLTEAFRATFLPPEEIDRRPDSIGKAIPNTEVLVLRPDGTECDANEPGELVQRGALVGLGYWNDQEKTMERYKPLPVGVGGREGGLALPEIVVFSGDTVRRDEDGFLYFIGRNDEMIKTSGYRVSPTEVEEILHSTGLVTECAAFGLQHQTLGQSIAVAVCKTPQLDGLTDEAFCASLVAECRRRMPAYMVPSKIVVHTKALPRNANGKIDRNTLKQGLTDQNEVRAIGSSS